MQYRAVRVKTKTHVDVVPSLTLFIKDEITDQPNMGMSTNRKRIGSQTKSCACRNPRCSQRLQRRHLLGSCKEEASDSTAGIGTAPPIVQDVLASTGRPLDAATRAFFEPRFGHDFGNVGSMLMPQRPSPHGRLVRWPTPAGNTSCLDVNYMRRSRIPGRGCWRMS